MGVARDAGTVSVPTGSPAQETRLVAAAAVVSAAVLVTLLLGDRPPLAGLAATGWTLHTVGERTSDRMGMLFAAPFVAYAAAGQPFAVPLLVAVVVLLVTGGARRTYAERVSLAVATGARQDMAHAHAAREERARIARELHDVVAHHISLISVQAETARLTVPGMPSDGADRLRAIGDTARQALTEMRRVLGVLRDDAGADADQLPQPGLAQLLTLTDQARTAGGPGVRLIVHGSARRLDPGLELTAYRIVQEALTNARRHAPGGAVDIEVGFQPDALRLHIWNTGTDGGDRPPREGFGLLGMRERAALAGGTLRTGHSLLGGFVVEAVLPTASR